MARKMVGMHKVPFLATEGIKNRQRLITDYANTDVRLDMKN